MPDYTIDQRKRDLLSSSDDDLSNGPSDVHNAPSRSLDRPRKRTRSSNYRYLILHRVICSRQANHENHVQDALYLDSPRLFAGDSKASALRGRHRFFMDLDEYLEDKKEVLFLVYRSYSCNDYCYSHRSDFRPLPTPEIDHSAIAMIRLYFFRLDNDGEAATPHSEEIQAVSNVLRKAMHDLETNYPACFKGWGTTRLQFPYSQVYLSRQLLLECGTGTQEHFDKSRQEQIMELFNYIRVRRQQDWKEADELFHAGQVSKLHFPKLFGPDEVLVTMDNSVPLAYVCKGATIDGTVLQLDCWSWQYNGVFFRRQKSIMVAWPQVSEQICITDLSIYPLRFDKSGLRERLQMRGKQFWTCRQRKFVCYPGPRGVFEMQHSMPRYMVDTTMYNELHETESTSLDELGQAAFQEDTPPKEPFCLLLPPTIRGYGMHDKKWANLNVEQIRDVEWNENAFEQRLVLKPIKKELIKALVTVHASGNDTTTTDVIENKGKGLVILLHGGPGTGKTLTAETVAELSKRPLYRVTCGDIGTDPEAVEKYLESVLYIGTVWKCVILLDEADVFLEERTQTDLQRNGLVSVFLRILEYYEGILILTSNRVGMFDEAFMSRIQLALFYPALDEDGRFEIWDNFLQTLRGEVENFNYDELKQKRNVLARHKLNGRQIRNTVNTARQLARFRGDRLGYHHFHEAIEVLKEFVQYIEDTHGHTNEEWAKSQRLRA